LKRNSEKNRHDFILELSWKSLGLGGKNSV
jgi:hypothetical protein